MARSENTAANKLIARVSGGQARVPSARMMAADPMHTTRPVTMPVAAPFKARSSGLPTSYPVVSRAMFESPAPAVDDSITQPINRRAGYRRRRHADDQFVGTLKMKHSDLRIVVGKLVLPMVLLVIAGIAIGGYVVLSGELGKPSYRTVAAGAAAPRPAVPEPAPAAVPEPAPAAVPEPAPAATPEPAPVATPMVSGNAARVGGGEPPAPVQTVARTSTLVEVRIDSTPGGAQVALVDRGKSRLVGSTPVNATVDASREYDLVFTYPNTATQIEHLDAKTTRRVAVALGAQASAAKPTDSVPRRREKASAESVPAAPVKKTGKAAAEPVLGEGTLMISSKPPCEILIDGKPTGLTTPQRSIPLPAGNHKITLVNSEKDIQKTIGVQITANATEKVIEDLMP